MSAYDDTRLKIEHDPKTWLVTGVAGFIGSNLLEALLRLDQCVIGVDNFTTGKKENLEQVKERVEPKQWKRFEFKQGDILEPAICKRVCEGADFVLHQAALVSVPLSMNEPARCHENNVTGFVNVLVAARDAKVKRVVYASSSAVYGDDPGLPKVEEKLGKMLSPYAATKLIDEHYATLFSQAYGLDSIGLRYFNVFGPRQDPAGGYAAVIPKWISAMRRGDQVQIYGDGETSRDFCYIDNVIQANLLAAIAPHQEACNQVYNIGVGEKTSLNELFILLKRNLSQRLPQVADIEALYRPFRGGDVRHSLADISKATRLLGYLPKVGIEHGLELTIHWYVKSTNEPAEPLRIPDRHRGSPIA